VPAMKVNLSAAMRARDVSRPRPEQLAEAEAAEASIADSSGGPRGNSDVADAPEDSAREGSGALEGSGVRRGESAWDVTGSRVRHVASAKARDAAETRDGVKARDAAETRDGVKARDAAETRDGPGTRDGPETRDGAGTRDGAKARDAARVRDSAGAEDGGVGQGREGQETRAARGSSEGTRKRRMPRNSPRRGRRADLQTPKTAGDSGLMTTQQPVKYSA
jgi:transcription termination factor Rho